MSHKSGILPSPLEKGVPAHSRPIHGTLNPTTSASILHDYPDDKCHGILRNLFRALDRDSLLLVDEIVLWSSGVQWPAAQLDLAMMAALGSRVRIREQWGDLHEGVGLRIRDAYTYTFTLEYSMIVAVSK